MRIQKGRDERRTGRVDRAALASRLVGRRIAARRKSKHEEDQTQTSEKHGDEERKKNWNFHDRACLS
jgi:hypothetical protein